MRLVARPFAVLAALFAGLVVLSLAAARPAEPPPAELAGATGRISVESRSAGRALLVARRLAPGRSVKGAIVLRNTGTRPARLRLTQSIVSSRPGRGGARLLGVLLLSITEPGRKKPVFSGRLARLRTKSLRRLAVRGARRYTFVVTLPRSADNRYQAASLARPLPLEGDGRAVQLTRRADRMPAYAARNVPECALRVTRRRERPDASSVAPVRVMRVTSALVGSAGRRRLGAVAQALDVPPAPRRTGRPSRARRPSGSPSGGARRSCRPTARASRSRSGATRRGCRPCRRGARRARGPRPARPTRSALRGDSIESSPTALTKVITPASIGPTGTHDVTSARPVGLSTRTISAIARSGSGAKMTAKIEITQSNDASSNGRSSAPATTNSASGTRTRATSTRRSAGSAPVTCAPLCAATAAALPVPQPRSSTRSPGLQRRLGHDDLGERLQLLRRHLVLADAPIHCGRMIAGHFLQLSVVARTTQRERAEEIQRLHAREQLMVVPNAWDAASARLIEALGFETLATTSSAMAWSYGDADGQNMGLENVLAVVSRMANAVDVPISVDYEGGYLDEAGDIERSVEAVLESGAVGFGLEDTDFSAETGIVPAEEHAELIAAAREVCSRRSIPALIVGRTELFLRTDTSQRDGGDEAVRRLKLYAEAGADVVFAPGAEHPELVGRLIAEVPKPLNVLRLRRSTELSVLAELGVRRVTLGGNTYLKALAGLERGLTGLSDGSFDAWDELGTPAAEVFERIRAPRSGN